MRERRKGQKKRNNRWTRGENNALRNDVMGDNATDFSDFSDQLIFTALFVFTSEVLIFKTEKLFIYSFTLGS